MTITLTKETEELLAKLSDDQRDEFVNEAILQEGNQEALAMLDKMVEEAEASGFREVKDISTYFEEMIIVCHKRNAHSL